MVAVEPIGTGAVLRLSTPLCFTRAPLAEDLWGDGRRSTGETEIPV